MEELYRARIGVYRAAADIVIPANGSIHTVMEEVRSALKIPPIQNK
jgi:shikimate kinase